MKLADMQVTQFCDVLASDAPAQAAVLLPLWRALWAPL